MEQKILVQNEIKEISGEEVRKQQIFFIRKRIKYLNFIRKKIKTKVNIVLNKKNLNVGTRYQDKMLTTSYLIGEKY